MHRIYCFALPVRFLVLALASANTDETCGTSGPDESCGVYYTIPPIEKDGSVEFAFGKKQVVGVNPSKELVDLMRTMNNYMQDQDRERCTLNFDMCVRWASIGECDVNPLFMQKECAPACLSCSIALMSFEERCPIPADVHLNNVWQNGDLHRMFERIVKDEQIRKEYGLNVLLHPGMPNPTRNTDGSPWVVSLDTFLSAEECNSLIQHGHDMGYEESSVTGATPKRDINRQSRTSSNSWCRAACYVDAAPILERIERLTGIPQPNFEHLQLLRYEVGQFYKTHSDYIPHHLERAHGPRLLTVFLYLNEVEEGKQPVKLLFKATHMYIGGETNFPILNITVQPKRGRALIWPSVMDHDLSLKDFRTDHQALPVVKGVKYSANAWLHLRDFQTPFAQNCL